MKHCIITPTKYINDPDIGGRSDFLLALSHLIDIDCQNEYSQAVLEFWKTKPIYLDNWLFENHVPENFNTLIDKWIKIWAEYVFAPDVLYNNKETQKELIRFTEEVKKKWAKFKIAYVVQAESMEEYLEAFNWALNNKDISLIWLSILSIPHSFSDFTWTPDITTNRIVALKFLHNKFKITKPCHLLWLWWSLEDLKIAKNYSWIISNDSSSAFQTWCAEKIYINNQVPGGKIEKKVDFEQKTITLEQQNAIETNINTIFEIIK
jgi:hypothetical protein